FGGKPRQVAFTPEGRYVVVAGANGAVTILRTPPPYGASPDRSVLDARSPTAHTNLGNVFWSQQKLDEAMACYKKALALDPKFVRAHANLGQVLVSKNKVDEGLVSLRKSVELAPKYPIFHLFLAGALARKGEVNEAIASYRKVIE